MSSQKQPLLEPSKMQPVYRIVKEKLSYDLRDRQISARNELGILFDTVNILRGQETQKSRRLERGLMATAIFYMVWSIIMIPFFDKLGEAANKVVIALILTILLSFIVWGIKGMIELQRTSKDLEVINERINQIANRQ